MAQTITMNSEWKIDGIPDDVWLQFRKKAEELLPEKGSEAWSAALANFIISVIDQKHRTFLMTDIPAEASSKFENACDGAMMRPDEAIARIFKAAYDEHLQILNIAAQPEDDPNSQTVWMIYGIPVAAWEGWEAAAKKVNTTPSFLLGHLLQAAANGNLKLNREKNGTEPPQKNTTWAGGGATKTWNPQRKQ